MAVKSSFKNMTLCLLAICLVCSALLAGVYALTKEPIEVAKKAKNDAANKFVMPEEAIHFGDEMEIAYNGNTYKYVTAYDAAPDASGNPGNMVGYVIGVAPVGFGGPIEIKVGITVDGIIWNTKVLSQSETPGLGAKCVEPAFAGQFKEMNPAEMTLKVRKDGGDIDAITASTITSRAYVDGIKQAVGVYNEIIK